MDFKLIIKKLNNTLTEDESAVFSDWYNDSKEHQNYFHRVQKNYAKDAIQVDIEKGWRELNRKLRRRSLKTRYIKYSAAAAVLILASLPFVINKTNEKDEIPKVTAQEPIFPGSDKAILTLESGEQVALEKGKSFTNEQVNSDGENLIYTKNSDESEVIAYNYLTIPRGGQFFIQFSDGTKVWMNSESKLKYPVAFTKGKTRQVELVYGEAYFDVSESTNHNGSKFMVNTKVQDVEVLGTEFNINAYDNNDFILTTLVEGKVTVSNGVLNETLSPGLQSNVHIKDDKISISKVDVAYETAWKNGLFVFRNENLDHIMTKLSRWYDVEVVFNEKIKKEMLFSGRLPRENIIDDILSKFEITGDVQFIITDKTITIK